MFFCKKSWNSHHQSNPCMCTSIHKYVVYVCQQLLILILRLNQKCLDTPLVTEITDNMLDSSSPVWTVCACGKSSGFLVWRTVYAWRRCCPSEGQTAGRHPGWWTQSYRWVEEHVWILGISLGWCVCGPPGPAFIKQQSRYLKLELRISCTQKRQINLQNSYFVTHNATERRKLPGVQRQLSIQLHKPGPYKMLLLHLGEFWFTYIKSSGCQSNVEDNIWMGLPRCGPDLVKDSDICWARYIFTKWTE